MRGHDAIQNSWFSYVSLEDRISKQHPLRRLRLLVDGVLASMDTVFAERYSHTGRPSIAPEKLLRALLLQVLYTVRSERQLMEQLDYNLLFRWFGCRNHPSHRYSRNRSRPKNDQTPRPQRR